MSSADEGEVVERLCVRLLDVPAEIGFDRWPAIVRGRKRSEFPEPVAVDDEPVVDRRPLHWEKLCGPLRLEMKEVWRALPLVYALRTEVVDPLEEERVRVGLGRLYEVDFDDAVAMAKTERLKRQLYQEVYAHSGAFLSF